MRWQSLAVRLTLRHVILASVVTERPVQQDAPKAVTDASAAVVQNGEVPPADASPASEEMDVTDAVAAVDPVTEDTPRAVGK